MPKELLEFEQARQQGLITNQDIEAVRNMEALLHTALIQKKVMRALQESEKQPVRVLKTRRWWWALPLAAGVVLFYLSFGAIQFNDTLLESFTKGTSSAPPVGLTKSKQEIAIAHFKKGKEYLEIENPAVAIAEFQQVLKFESQVNERFLAFTEYHLALAYLRANMPDKAHEIFEKANRRNISFAGISWITLLKMRWQIFCASL